MSNHLDDEKYPPTWWLRDDRPYRLNVLIIDKTINARGRTLDAFRRDLAIYRMYRYLAVPMSLIIDVVSWANFSHGAKWRDRYSGYWLTWVQNRIGHVFKILCLSDSHCAFQKFLS